MQDAVVQLEHHALLRAWRSERRCEARSSPVTRQHVAVKQGATKGLGGPVVPLLPCVEAFMKLLRASCSTANYRFLTSVAFPQTACSSQPPTQHSPQKLPVYPPNALEAPVRTCIGSVTQSSGSVTSRSLPRPLWRFSSRGQLWNETFSCVMTGTWMRCACRGAVAPPVELPCAVCPPPPHLQTSDRHQCKLHAHHLVAVARAKHSIQDGCHGVLEVLVPRVHICVIQALVAELHDDGLDARLELRNVALAQTELHVLGRGGVRLPPRRRHRAHRRLHAANIDHAQRQHDTREPRRVSTLHADVQVGQTAVPVARNDRREAQLVHLGHGVNDRLARNNIFMRNLNIGHRAASTSASSNTAPRSDRRRTLLYHGEVLAPADSAGCLQSPASAAQSGTVCAARVFMPALSSYRASRGD
eukprot:363171-Chlamydomonas_euryale.AAC.9